RPSESALVKMRTEENSPIRESWASMPVAGELPNSPARPALHCLDLAPQPRRLQASPELSSNEIINALRDDHRTDPADDKFPRRPATVVAAQTRAARGRNARRAV